MSVTAKLSLPAVEFELGRILNPGTGGNIRFERMVCLVRPSIPLFWHHNGSLTFEANVRKHAAVDDLWPIRIHDDRTLYAIEYQLTADDFLSGLGVPGTYLLEAMGDAHSWTFELLFRSSERLSKFHGKCVDAGIPVEIERITSASDPSAELRYDLTAAQQETLVHAVKAGYFAVPRGTSMSELAESFDISTQAVSERLRRGIDTLVWNTLLRLESDSKGPSR